jgi:glycosyltransferase involved in cell wall biosynthesis|uniref:Glycosyl transferase family 1 domain-containing protein n=1 Tax=viral metagenome TaxID=1070528 RepID=A0A6C0CZB6_9ZZZZ
MPIRLHIFGLPYTITRQEFSGDPSTEYILNFGQMMINYNFEVFHYGVETSQPGYTNKNINILTKEEWEKLRIESIMLKENITYEDAVTYLKNPKNSINELATANTPLCVEFNKRLKLNLQANYRDMTTDIICINRGILYNEALNGINCVVVEIGISDKDSSKSFRIFNSNSCLTSTIAIEKCSSPNYWFFIPPPFNITDWRFNLNPFSNNIGFLGHISNHKGCHIIVEIAKRFPNTQFTLCGPGDPNIYLSLPNIVYKSPIYGTERSEYLGQCTAVLLPSTMCEMFSRVAVESQLCGTPVITNNSGAMIEIVKQFRTGLRCNTLADYCHGIKLALDGKFNRVYIRERAAKKYDMYKIGYKYEYALRSIVDVFTPGKKGWYCENSHMNSLQLYYKESVKPKIYLFLPYFGKFPNYFQLYLDSLEVNIGLLVVFIITDIDLTHYKLPLNAIPIFMTLDTLRERLSKMLGEVYEKVINPNNLVQKVYKLVDFKITYPIIFNDLILSHKLTDQDFVGWGDCDLIYGNLHNFINFNENFHIIGGWHGHFTAIRNIDSFKNLFKTVPKYLELCTDNSMTFVTDEIAFRQPLINYLRNNNYKMFYINKCMCDIVPPMFYHLVRPNHPEFKKNFFNNRSPNKNINYVYFSKKDKQLITVYDDGESHETTYCHLQKRSMSLNFTEYTEFYIKEHEFSLVLE